MRRAIITLSVSNIVSKPLGLLRQMLFATFYGVTAVMSACRFAQTMTMAFMNFFTTDTLNAGFLPLYQRYKQDSAELAQCFFWLLFALIMLLSCLIFTLLYWGAPWIVSWFAPGFEGQVVAESIGFIQIFAFAVPFCLLGTLFSYLAMSGDSYISIGTRPMFESVGLIAGVLLSVWTHQVLVIAWAFVVAYVLFFFMVVSICYHKQQLQSVAFSIWRRHARQLARDFWQTVRPLLALPLFMQGKFIAEKFFASLMAISVVASLDYARFIVETGINVIAVPIGLVGLSAFSCLNGKQLAEKLEPIVTVLFLVTVPITAFLILNSKLVVSMLYGYGAFNAYAIDQASLILTGMALAFFAQVIAYVLIKVLSSQLQNRRVVAYMMTALSANILFIALFYKMLGPLVLGLGESLYGSIVFMLCLYHFKLFHVMQRLTLFLLPAVLIYSAIALYLQPVFIQQVLWFAFFWAVALLLPRQTRTLLLEKVLAR